MAAGGGESGKVLPPTEGGLNTKGLELEQHGRGAHLISQNLVLLSLMQAFSTFAQAFSTFAMIVCLPVVKSRCEHSRR